jgi:hypothetical protein
MDKNEVFEIPDNTVVTTEEKPKKSTRAPVSDERKAQMLENLRRGREAKKAKKEAAEKPLEKPVEKVVEKPILPKKERKAEHEQQEQFIKNLVVKQQPKEKVVRPTRKPIVNTVVPIVKEEVKEPVKVIKEPVKEVKQESNKPTAPSSIIQKPIAPVVSVPEVKTLYTFKRAKWAA